MKDDCILWKFLAKGEVIFGLTVRLQLNGEGILCKLAGKCWCLFHVWSQVGKTSQEHSEHWPSVRCSYNFSVAFCSPAKSLTFSGLVENPLAGKKVKS